MIAALARWFAQMALQRFGIEIDRMRLRYDGGEQNARGENRQAPERWRGHAAKRGEDSGALVCGSSSRIINR